MERVKILFIHDKLVCGGAEQALFDLTCLMDKEKFDITILTLDEGGEWESKFRAESIRVESIWSCQKKSSNPIVKIENWLKRRRIIRAIKDNGRGLLEACQQSDYDIIVAYKMGYMQQACFVENAKTVKYIHGNVATNAGFRDRIKDSQDDLERFDLVVCVSEESKEALSGLTGITNLRACFNPLNSENVRKKALEEAVIDGNTPIVCAVGRLAPEKGYDRLIRIHKKIYEEGYKHRLVIVGEGPMREMLENIIQSIHCEESVTLVGYASNPYKYMRKADFLVCSSYTEALPVIAMEALSLGIPIVSAVPSIGELFGKETCGMITENDDMSLEFGIRSMLCDREFYAKAKVGAEKRSQYFEGKRMVREIEEMFSALVDA